MGHSDATTGTRIDQVGDEIYRISTPVAAIPGGFTLAAATARRCSDGWPRG